MTISKFIALGFVVLAPIAGFSQSAGSKTYELAVQRHRQDQIQVLELMLSGSAPKRTTYASWAHHRTIQSILASEQGKDVVKDIDLTKVLASESGYPGAKLALDAGYETSKLDADVRKLLKFCKPKAAFRGLMLVKHSGRLPHEISESAAAEVESSLRIQKEILDTFLASLALESKAPNKATFAEWHSAATLRKRVQAQRKIVANCEQTRMLVKKKLPDLSWFEVNRLATDSDVKNYYKLYPETFGQKISRYKKAFVPAFSTTPVKRTAD